MSAPAGYKQLPSGFWVKGDGSGPYFVDAETGTATAVGSGVTNVNGAEYLTLSNGTLMPLTPVVGTGEAPKIAGVYNMLVQLDAGSDINHAKLLYTWNCTTGDPDTEDTALASSRFNATGNAEVIDLNLSGGSAGSIVVHSPSSGAITMVHLAFAGGGTYTQAAGGTVTGTQMVLCKWDSTLGITAAILYIGDSYAGGGSNQRYRQIVVVGFKP